MEGYRKLFTYLISKSHTGPLVLIDGALNEDDLQLAAQITARFGHGKLAEQVEIEAHFTDGSIKSLQIKPLGAEEMKAEWYI